MPARVDTRTMNAFLTTTMSEYLPTLHDNIFDDVPMLSYLNGKLGRAIKNANKVKEVKQGGDEIVEPLLYGRNSTFGSYDGAEALDTTLQDGITNAKFPWKYFSVAVGIVGAQKRGNRSKYRLINLLQAKTTQAELTAQESLNQQAYADGSGNGGKDLDGWGKHISTTAVSGGLDPAIHTWWAPNITTAVGSFAANGKSKMTNLFNTLTMGNIGPEVMFTTQAIHEAYEESLTDQKRFTNTMAADAGFENITFKNRPVLYDRDCPTGDMYFLNSRYIKWVTMAGADLEMQDAGFQTPIGQDASVAMILLQANITISNRRRIGKLTGITTP
jgi:hypothetical protein